MKHCLFEDNKKISDIKIIRLDLNDSELIDLGVKTFPMVEMLVGDKKYFCVTHKIKIDPIHRFDGNFNNKLYTEFANYIYKFNISHIYVLFYHVCKITESVDSIFIRGFDVTSDQYEKII